MLLISNGRLITRSKINAEDGQAVTPGQGRYVRRGPSQFWR